MCIIVDANQCADFFNAGHPRYKDLRDTLFGIKRDDRCKPRLVLGGTKLRSEYDKVGVARKSIAILAKAGRVNTQFATDEQVDALQDAIDRASVCKSDDPHIIAVARLSGARVLISEDGKLIKDFKNPNVLSPRGYIYAGSHHYAVLVRHCGR